MTSIEILEPDARERTADDAAARGDLLGAAALLAQIVAEHPQRIDSWLKLAGALRATGDVAGAIEAATRALAADPLHVVALLTRGRLLEGAGRARQAARDYTHALDLAPDDGAALPAGLRPLLAHARTVAGRLRDETEARWKAAIAAGPPLDPVRRARITRFKTNALRSTHIYHAEPTHYHYPGLPEREFHDRADFPWLSRLEAATDMIRAEMLALIGAETGIAEPYVQYAADQPVRQWAALNHSLDWTAFHLLKGGKPVAENVTRCPVTMAALVDIPQPRLARRGPNAMFSLLKPHTRIPPHHGVANTRLVCHLPLVVPPNCWFRVGAETRSWHEGEAMVFDDTIEHEAANDSDVPRVVLILDVWHPFLDAAERDAVARAMNADGGGQGGSI